MGSGGQSPTQMGQGMMDTAMDPQKMISGFVGPTAAGVKGPPPKPGELKKPAGPAIQPSSFGDLQQKYSLGGAGGDAGLDPETAQFLAMLAGGGR